MRAVGLFALLTAGIIAFLWRRDAAASVDWTAQNDPPAIDPGLADNSNFYQGADMAPSPVSGLLDAWGISTVTDTASTSGARGLRNNNPGNIRASAIAWQGKTGNDGTFEIFATAADGIRALGRNLLAYQNKHGDATIAQLITRWAPANENNTAAYIAAVSREVGIDAQAPVNLGDSAILAKITAAIIRHENGTQPYDLGMIQQNVSRA